MATGERKRKKYAIRGGKRGVGVFRFMCCPPDSANVFSNLAIVGGRGSHRRAPVVRLQRLLGGRGDQWVSTLFT